MPLDIYRFNEEVEEDGIYWTTLLNTFPYSNVVASGVANTKVAVRSGADVFSTVSDGRPCSTSTLK